MRDRTCAAHTRDSDAHAACIAQVAWRGVRVSLLSAVLWEVLASRLGPSRLVLAVVSVYGGGWWALLAYVRVRVGLLLETDT